MRPVSGNSAHSNYLCQGLSCAEGSTNRAVLQDYRNSEAYSPATVITRDDVIEAKKAEQRQREREEQWSEY